MKVAEAIQQQLHPTLEHFINWAAVGTTVGAIMGLLPGVAALFSIVWLGLQIWLFIFIKKPWRRHGRGD